MKAVMISIRKEHNEKIFSGVKKWEGRKTVPAIVKIWNTLDNRCDYQPAATDVTFYIYEPKSGGGCGKVVGEFVCDFAQSFPRNSAAWSEIAKALCVDIDFVYKYFSKKYGYMIRVCNPVKYDKPKELREFYKAGKEIYCNKCEHIELRFKPLSECDCFCNKYNENLVFYDDFLRCDSCIKNEASLTRPPQSWCYVEVDE